MSYTPGPWIVATSCSWRRIISERGDHVCVPTIQEADNHPDLYFPNGGPDGPDANLLRTAPDLMEGCQHALITLEGLWECYADNRQPSMDEWNDAMKALRKTISQAEGKS